MRRSGGRSPRTSSLVAVAAFAIGAPSAAVAQQHPLRSGTIVGDAGVTVDAGRCDTSPDCLAWQATGCSASSPLVGRDPALFTSIVDVRHLADGSSMRTLTSEGTWLTGTWLTNISVALWTDGCRSVTTPGLDCTWTCSSGRRFKIPAGVRWMTVIARYSIPVSWELR